MSWFDFKEADAAWDKWLASKGLKCPLKPIGAALTEADRKLKQALDEADRNWGLKK